MISYTEDTHAWMEEFHKMADSLTTDDLDKFYTKNSTIRYGNNDELKGLDDITAFFAATFPAIESMKHEPVEVDRIGNKIYLSCFITYVAKNDPEEKKIKIPAFGKFFMIEEGENKGMIERFEVFLDPSELFAKIMELSKGA